MIEEPGCICGRLISLNPQRGPEASIRMSLQILVSFADVRFSTPDRSTYAPVSEVASIRSPARMNLVPVNSDRYLVASSG